MLAAAGAVLLILWLILWGIYHLDSAALNAPLLAAGLGCLLLSVILTREGGEDVPESRGIARVAESAERDLEKERAASPQSRG
ncbi:MAG TPA: hypothetical protein VE996_12375 [Terriglobales bacterium]|nr:hypothetical protein [Terriglobales bacterium]